MTLKPGTMLGPYEIRELIGKGGMGEVYRAHDAKLKREVALKVLPEQFARDPDRVARFRREAQLLASLNHTNIAAVYGLEESGETPCLVMEYVPGETLRDRLIREGAVPVEEALPIGSQMAEALEAAHEKAIIHRDLKPANVKLTPQGQVKVLDFGLAKAFAGDSADVSDSQAPTLTASPTIPGTILGTAAYMSPEQAKGKTVDKRTDIWAFGCVLYELLTGKGAFQSRDREGAEADTVQEIIARVLQSEPDWTLLPEGTPHGIRVLLRRCLQKDAKNRFRDAADVHIQIEETQAAPAVPVATPAPPPVPEKPRWQRIGLLGLAFVAVAALGGIAVWTLKPTPPRPVTRTMIALPQEERLSTNLIHVLAISPDGSNLVYGATAGGTRQLYLRALDSLESRPIPGTEGADQPFFSPDGQSLGFYATGNLKKVSLSGGGAQTISNAPSLRGAAWGPDDTIVFSPSGVDALWQVSAAGGTPQKLTSLREGEINHRWPEFLPGGKAVVFVASIGGSTIGARIEALRLDTGERKVLVQGANYSRFAPTGHLVYYRDGTVLAVPFDAERLEVTGAPAPVIEGVMSGLAAAPPAAFFSFSKTGVLAYVPGVASGDQITLAWVDRKGVEQVLKAPPRPYDDPRLSPDGQRIALAIGNDVWVYDIARDTLTRLTFEGVNDIPLWTPDGKRITYIYGSSAGTDIRWKLADGSGGEETLVKGEPNPRPQSWSADGKVLAFTEAKPETGTDIWTLTVEGDPSTAGAGRKPRPFLQTKFTEVTAMISPDAHWMAYVSNESGKDEVYVQPFPGPGGKWQISTGGGVTPMWAKNGRELFYQSDDKLMAVDITTQPAFTAGSPKVLFEGRGRYQWSTARPDYDVSADGQRFLMKKSGAAEVTTSQINIVQNWFEELRRRVPVQ